MQYQYGLRKNYSELTLNFILEDDIGQAMRRIAMTMQDWVNKLDGFLSLNDRDILTHAGKISHQIAKQAAEQE